MVNEWKWSTLINSLLLFDIHVYSYWFITCNNKHNNEIDIFMDLTVSGIIRCVLDRSECFCVCYECSLCYHLHRFL